MKLETFNDLLGKLAAEPNQQNLLNVAYGLMGWMGIEHTEKPKILTPKTDKLRKYLQTRKELSRPDLRVISAPDQPIEVRIGMLHNIGKNQLYYLVDRDTRIDAWQNEPGPIQKRSKTPYIFHFATDHKYDRLLFILHQNGQKRIMILRDRLSQTQYNKILQAIENVGKLESKYEIQERLWNCLDLKEVNKSFYKEVKTKYDALVEILRTNYAVNGNQESQFAVRLIGRYIFCWFLKEKGIIDKNIIGSKIIRETPDFYENLLKKLFFNTLNTEVGLRTAQAELSAEIQAQLKRIPYLNGGLFDQTAEDNFFTKLELNDWLNSFVQVLEQYDFTVDESSPSYQQIAIDPEMLGRIFENLLASINPETEKLANERKAFGAFYTPREIVEYMVNQSLRCYLETHLLPEDKEKDDDDHQPLLIAKEPAAQLDIFRPTAVQTVMEIETEKKKSGEEIAREKENERRRKELKEKLDKFFEEGADNPFTKEETAQVRQLLDNCKVLDPACGSGAFPMGVLYKLEQLHETLGVAEKEDELRLRILSNNIFGVDIMPMAVDISRLRAWLSIVLVADYKPNQPKNNFNVHPLPNLDFKFVCANTLIDVPENTYIQNENEKLLVEFEELTKKYFSSKFHEKDAIKDKIEKCIKAIASSHEKAINSLIEAVKNSEKSLKRTQKVVSFDEYGKSIETESDSKNQNSKLKNKTKKQIEDLATYERQKRQWESYKHIFENKPVEFFKTKYFFPSAEKGFDVVIGNPPYVQMQKDNGKLAELYKNSGYSTYERTGDVYSVFYERGFQLIDGEQKTNKNTGVLCFITSSQWVKANYGKTLRKYFMQRDPILLLELGPGVFDSAVVDTNILLSSNQCNTKRLAGAIVNPHDLTDLSALELIPMAYVNEDFWTIVNPSALQFKEKLIQLGKPLHEWKINIYRGILTGLNEAFIINQETRDKLIINSSHNKTVIKPVLKGKEIKKYYVDWKNDYIIFIPWHFPLNNISSIVGASIEAEKAFQKDYPVLFEYFNSHKISLNARNKEETGIRYEWYALQRCAATYLEEFSKEKIVWKRIGSSLRFSFVSEEMYCLDSTCIATGEKLKYLTALLNSKLIEYQLIESAPRTGMGDLIISVQALEPLHVYYPTDSEEEKFVVLIDQILTLKKSDPKADTSALERKIDMMVYHLYGLTLEEARVVDASVGEEEFEVGRKMLG